MYNGKDEEKQTSKRKTLQDYRGYQSWIKEGGTEATEDYKHSNYCLLYSVQIHHLRQSGAVLQEFWVSHIATPTAKKLDGMSWLETESPAIFI